MSPIPSRSLALAPGDAAVTSLEGSGDAGGAVDRVSPSARAEALQRSGRRMIIAGFVITILGVVLYCAACFAGGADADLGDVLFRNAAPFARATLAFLGVGTLVWLIGSFRYLRGALDADQAP